MEDAEPDVIAPQPVEPVEDEVITTEQREAKLQAKIQEQAGELAEQADRIEALEGELQTLWKGYQGAGGLAVLLMLGTSLTQASRAFFGELGLGKPVPRKEAADLFAAVVRRVVFVGFVGLLVAGIPIWLMWEQNRLVESQNAAILEQNAKIQTQLAQQARATNNQEEDTRTVRRTQLLTLIYEEEDCDLAGELETWEERKTAAEAGRRFAERRPERCAAKAPHRLRREAVEALAKLDGDALDLSGANFKWADLEGLDLEGVDLSMAYLPGATLNGAKLSKATLDSADLKGARLSKADLSGANLETANFRSASLSMANLSGANLRGAKLSKATLSGADLSKATLVWTIFSGADLSEAVLSEAVLYGVHLREARNLTQKQLDSAFGDHRTELPYGLERPEHWQKEGEGFDTWKARLEIMDKSLPEWLRLWIGH